MSVRWFKRLFRIPGPKELGWSQSGALPSRYWSFSDESEEKTWDDWEEWAQREYPIRYFLRYTLGDALKSWAYRVGHAWYRAKCAILPSHHYHLVDLRGVDPLSDYTYGYRDPCSVMYLAAWAALRQYVEQEEPQDPASWASPEQLAEEPLRTQKEKYDEAMALHRWWTVERRAEQEKEHELHDLVEAARKLKNRDGFEAAAKVWLDYAHALELKEQDQFLRLAKLRPYLWT